MKNKNIATIIVGTALILIIPLAVMQFNPEVDWSLFDFIIAGILLLGTGFSYEFLSRNMKTVPHRLALGILLVLLLFIIWADLAVGIFNIPGISGS